MAALEPSSLATFMLRRREKGSCRLLSSLSARSQSLSESLAMFSSPLIGHVCVMWPLLAARDTEKVKFECYFFPFEACIMGGRGQKGSWMLVRSAIDWQYIHHGCKWSGQHGSPGGPCSVQPALTIRFPCTTVVLVTPQWVKGTRSCLRGAMRRRSTWISLSFQISLSAKMQNIKNR